MQEYRPETRRDYRPATNRVAESLMMERRINLRLLGYWEKLRGTRQMPAESEFHPEDINDLWNDCMLVKVGGPGKPDTYSYMSPGIIELYRSDLKEEEKGSLIALQSPQIILGCKKVAESGRPVVHEGEFYNNHNELVKFRLCLLPLGEHGQVTAILGGMRFKVFRTTSPTRRGA